MQNSKSNKRQMHTKRQLTMNDMSEKPSVTVTNVSDLFDCQSKEEYFADPKNQVQRDFAARTAWRNNEFICYHGGELNEGCERIEFSAHQKDDGTKVINVDFDTNCHEVACMRLSLTQVRELQSALTKLIGDNLTNGG